MCEYTVTRNRPEHTFRPPFIVTKPTLLGPDTGADLSRFLVDLTRALVTAFVYWIG